MRCRLTIICMSHFQLKCVLNSSSLYYNITTFPFITFICKYLSNCNQFSTCNLCTDFVFYSLVPILFLLPALVYFLQVIQPVLLFYLSSPWFSLSSNDPLLSSSDTMIGLSGVVSSVLICLIYFLFFLYIWPSSVLIMKLLRSWHLLGQFQVSIDHISASPPFHQYVNHQMVLHSVCSAFFIIVCQLSSLQILDIFCSCFDLQTLLTAR